MASWSPVRLQEACGMASTGRHEARANCGAARPRMVPSAAPSLRADSQQHWRERGGLALGKAVCLPGTFSGAHRLAGTEPSTEMGLLIPRSGPLSRGISLWGPPEAGDVSHVPRCLCGYTGAATLVVTYAGSYCTVASCSSHAWSRVFPMHAAAPRSRVVPGAGHWAAAMCSYMCVIGSLDSGTRSQACSLLDSTLRLWGDSSAASPPTTVAGMCHFL